MTASYPGDNSYQNSVGSYGITVTPAATRILPPSPGCGSTCFVGAPIPLLGTVIATTSFVGAGITGEITFYDATAQLGVVTINGPGGSTSSPALAQSSIMATFTTGGTHQISATYSGDANYGPASSSPTGISVVYATSGVLMASRGTVNLGQSVTVTATVTGASKTPPMTGTLQFSSAPPPTISVTGVSGTDSNGNQTLTATTSITPQVDGEIDVYYPGDANYGPTRASVFVTVNLPGFNMNINGPGPTITAGQSGSTVLTLTPVTNISSSVALTCNSTVAGSTCSFNPPSPIALSGGAAASTTITITTLPPSSSPTTTLIGSRPRRSPGIPPLGRWTLGFADALIAFVLLTFSGKRRGLAARLGFAGFLCLVLGCGAGGNGGDGGGGGRGSTPPTSLTLTVSTVKAAYGVTPNLTATLNSGGNPTTGTITFFDSGLPFFSTGASHIVSFGLPGLNVGTHVISAQYSGDSNNQPSTSGSINLVITGSTWVFVTGTSPGVSNNTQFPVTIQ